MPPANFKRRWIKLFIDECLTGTIREDLTPTQRSLWYDFLLLAGRNRPPGCISANEKTKLSPGRIAAVLNVPTKMVERAISKFIESERITVDRRGIIHIANWDKYQYTDYDRQKPYRQAARKASEDMTTEELLAEHLEEHPEEVTGSAESDSYDTDEVYADD